MAAERISTEVKNYIARLPRDRGAALAKLRMVIRRAVPAAVETMSYRMPTYELDGFFCAIAAKKSHLALYLCDAAVIERHRPALRGLDLGKGCIRFKRLQDLPLNIVALMLKEAARGRESAHRGVVVDKARGKLRLRSGREIALKPYHLPLTKRFPLGLTDAAYAKLRALAEASGIGNNYTLTVLLENADKTINRKAFEAAIARMKATMSQRNQ